MPFLSSEFIRDVIANRPVAGSKGRRFTSTDTGVEYYDDGSAWQAITLDAGQVTGTLAIAHGGTGQTTQQLAINALTGAQSSGKYLRSDGTNSTLDTLHAADLPTATTSTLGAVKVDGSTITIASGVITSTVAGGMTNPMTTAGDTIYGGSSGTPTRLAGGSSGYVLTSNGATSAPSWQAAGGGGSGPFSEQVLGSAQATVTFSSLPSTRDLRIVVRGKGTASATLVTLLLQANSDTTANYDWVATGANGSGVFGGSGALAASSAQLGWLPAATSVGTQRGFGVIFVPDFADTTGEKNFLGNGGVKTALSGAGVNSYQFSGWWRSTSAVTSITLSLSSGNFASGAVISLYSA